MCVPYLYWKHKPPCWGFSKTLQHITTMPFCAVSQQPDFNNFYTCERVALVALAWLPFSKKRVKPAHICISYTILKGQEPIWVVSETLTLTVMSHEAQFMEKCHVTQKIIKTRGPDIQSVIQGQRPGLTYTNLLKSQLQNPQCPTCSSSFTDYNPPNILHSNIYL